MNEYGLDVNYFKEKLSLILRDIGCYKPEEMHRELSRLADVVAPAQAQQESCIECAGTGKKVIHDSFITVCDSCRGSGKEASPAPEGDKEWN